MVKSIHRSDVLLLGLICMISFAKYYMTDIPGILQPQLIESIGSWSTNGMGKLIYSLLYSCYYLPIIIICIPLGIAIDWVGCGILTFISVGFFATGQYVFSLGWQLKDQDMMVVGRLFSGIGGESFMILQYAWLFQRFWGKSIIYPICSLVLAQRLGFICNILMTPGNSIQISSVICFLAFICSIFAYLSDEFFKDEKQQKDDQQIPSQGTLNGLFLRLETFPKVCKLWILNLSICCFISVGFNMNANNILIENIIDPNLPSIDKKNLANKYIIFQQIICLFFIPVVAKFIKDQGQRLQLSILNQLLLLITFMIFNWVSPIISQLLLGIHFAITCNICFPVLNFLFQRQDIGFFIGIACCLKYTLLEVSHQMTALTSFSYSSVNYLIAYFGFLSFVGLIINIQIVKENNNLKVSLNSVDEQNLLDQAQQLTKEYEMLISKEQETIEQEQLL